MSTASKDGARAAIDTADVFTGDFAPYLCPRHSSLVSWLVDLVKSHGIEVRYGAQIVHVDPQRPSVHLSSGDVEVGDLVIGADGYKSQIRTLVSGEELEFLQPHRVQYRYDSPCVTIWP
jgi:2-polyprenyl-6-methoxyphenol hydroxylase-like FAD-dependent oxidoreductase